jgi:outer membrane lipoprotein-sorting protein
MIAEGAPMPQYWWFKIRQAGRSFFYVAARHQTSWLLFLYLVAGMASASAQTGSSVPTAETIIASMAQARAENRARLRPYVVTREYKLYGKERQVTKSEVVADVTFVPPDSKEYTIQQINGSGLGKMIIGRMLEKEAEVTKDYGATDISPDNYDFRFIREEEVSGQRCYVLELLPRRKDKNLLRGNIWVDANTYLLRRTEGQPAKAPSWWVRDVRIALRYGDVGGMWLQTASEATAHVRILGPCTMVSRDVKYQITELVADASSAQTNFLNPMAGRSLRQRAIPRPPK